MAGFFYLKRSAGLKWVKNFAVIRNFVKISKITRNFIIYYSRSVCSNIIQYFADFPTSIIKQNKVCKNFKVYEPYLKIKLKCWIQSKKIKTYSKFTTYTHSNGIIDCYVTFFFNFKWNNCWKKSKNIIDFYLPYFRCYKSSIFDDWQGSESISEFLLTFGNPLFSPDAENYGPE